MQIVEHGHQKCWNLPFQESTPFEENKVFIEFICRCQSTKNEYNVGFWAKCELKLMQFPSKLFYQHKKKFRLLPHYLQWFTAMAKMPHLFWIFYFITESLLRLIFLLPLNHEFQKRKMELIFYHYFLIFSLFLFSATWSIQILLCIINRTEACLVLFFFSGIKYSLNRLKRQL